MVTLKKVNGYYHLTKREFLNAERVVVKEDYTDNNKVKSKFISYYYPNNGTVFSDVRIYKGARRIRHLQDILSEYEAWMECKRHISNPAWVEKCDVTVEVYPKKTKGPKWSKKQQTYKNKVIRTLPRRK